jgi:hypothetical protein
MVKKRRLGIKAILALICIVLITAGIVYLIFSKPRCISEGCFINSLWKCRQISYSNEQENATWYYSIKGYSGDSCDVYVKMVRLRSDVETATALVGKSMTCEIPKDAAGSFMPESKIEYCHGLLKESIQDLIIKKMHLFIIQNIGQINQSYMVPV